jgi:CheY-like chemotaxis protein
MMGPIELRRRAELRLASGGRLATNTWGDEVRLRHELEVHQVELQMQQEELEQSRDRYASLYDHAPAGIMTLDPRTRILDGNETARAMLGLERGFDGRIPLARFLDEDAADRLQLRLRRTTERGALALVVHPSHGPAFEAVLALSPAPVEGAMRAVLVDLRGAEHPRVESAPLAGLTVLLVDDEPLLRRALASVIADLGAQVRIADDTNHAVAIAATQPIDVLLTDINMPGENGPAIARRIRAVRPGTVVVYMSGEPKASHVRARRIDDQDRVLEKPFSPASLAEVVRAAVAAHGAAGQRRVLVVDPYEGGRRALCALLADMGCEAIGAADPAEAAAIVAQAPVELLIADHAPPWARAEAAVEAVRAAQPDVPALILTETKVDGAPAIPKSRVLRKPTAAAEVALVVDELLAKA